MTLTQTKIFVRMSASNFSQRLSEPTPPVRIVLDDDTVYLFEGHDLDHAKYGLLLEGESDWSEVLYPEPNDTAGIANVIRNLNVAEEHIAAATEGDGNQLVDIDEIKINLRNKNKLLGNEDIHLSRKFPLSNRVPTNTRNSVRTLRTISGTEIVKADQKIFSLVNNWKLINAKKMSALQLANLIMGVVKYKEGKLTSVSQTHGVIVVNVEYKKVRRSPAAIYANPRLAVKTKNRGFVRNFEKIGIERDLDIVFQRSRIDKRMLKNIYYFHGNNYDNLIAKLKKFEKNVNFDLDDEFESKIFSIINSMHTESLRADAYSN
jgi:hypothetical protein